MPFKMDEEGRNKLIDSVASHKREFEGLLHPLESLTPDKPAVFISVGAASSGIWL